MSFRHLNYICLKNIGKHPLFTRDEELTYSHKLQLS
ncbi:hypothetical protein IQ240_09650 [Nodularia sp. LEGE 04288]|nr:hypothetical protein [Nodularia sp. LEGE 04288]